MSFGVGSKVTTDFSGRWDDGAGLARQPDGKLIIVGMSRTTYSLADFAVVRLCENGSLDDGVHCGGPAFGAGSDCNSDNNKLHFKDGILNMLLFKHLTDK